MNVHLRKGFVRPATTVVSYACIIHVHEVQLWLHLPLNAAWETLMEVETHSTDYWPFPSKEFALLYFLVNGPHPLVSAMSL